VTSTDVLQPPDWWQDAIAYHQLEHDMFVPIHRCAFAYCVQSVSRLEDEL
jgi:hypothetical protein